jgi:hypothetical protein
MRYILVILFTICIIPSNGQSLVTYKDTINNFSISLPEGWKYGVNQDYPAIKLVAYRVPLSALDTVRDNLNINIFETPGNDLDKTFAEFLKALPDAKDFKLLDSGDTTFNGTHFKWLVETHKNKNNSVQMHNYDFVTFKDGKTYILTMVTFSYAYEGLKPLFDKIAGSFTLLE